MPGMFISGRLAITAAGITDEKDLTVETDVIFIRPKMDYGTRNKVVGAAAKMRQETAGNRRTRRARGKAAKSEQQVDFNVGEYSTALLVFNVLAWSGPSFMGVACTPENIATLDGDNPLVAKTVEIIAERNAPAEDDTAELDDPNVIDLTGTTTVA